ncbi:MAG TPA: benzoate-CoA ligase family protein [Gemmatimonadales bacterium]|nr:benzoate-CoA ligase family protein [Gemmatimonadales bacterium]
MNVDTFCRDHLPPTELWPDLMFGTIPELNYPDRLNCAGELLDRLVESGEGARTAFITDSDRWSYQRLYDAANRIARVLTEDLGVIPGNRVLLRAPNTPMQVACWFGILKAGGVVVCTMPLLRRRELAYIADKAEIRLALCDERVTADCDSGMSHHQDGRERKGARVVRFGREGGELEQMMATKPATFENVDTAADDTALIAFTSGTTGQGKGTMHFHRDVLAICDCFPPYVLRPTPDDIFCGTPPLAFTFGLGMIVLFPMRVGASAVLLEQSGTAALLDAIERHKVTICATAPTAYRAMLGHLGGRDISSLRRCVSAGETLPLGTFQAWEKATGIRIIDGIGSTEMLHIFISAADEQIRPGATGLPVPGYEAKVIGDDGEPVPAGEIGRLAVRGPTGCRYLDNMERQQAYVQDGWNLTGDSYRMDADGYFWYQARTDDMIVSSGYNISGPEVEAALLLHPAVQECGVVGVPDEERGQLVTAFVVLKPGHDGSADLVHALQKFVKSEIAPYKYPRAVHFLERLPRTDTGKLQRFRLREQAMRPVVES